jgi:hypothetical protein
MSPLVGRFSRRQAEQALGADTDHMLNQKPGANGRGGGSGGGKGRHKCAFFEVFHGLLMVEI